MLDTRASSNTRSPDGYAGTDALVKLRIGSKDLTRGSGGTHNLLSPVSGESLGTFPLAGKAEVDEAVELAHAASEPWRRWRPEDRRDVLMKLGLLLRQNADEIIRLSALDCGIPVYFGRVLAALIADFTCYYAGWADKLNGEHLAGYDTRGQFAYTTAQPLGVIGVILTWNGPAPSIGMKVCPALAAGNCVVVKPSEMAPLVCDLFARLARQAGIPAGVLSVVPGGPEAGEALVSHPKIAKISFTGGHLTARKIMAICGKNLKPTVLELGGKSASLLFPDADIDKACHSAIGWTMGALSGQGCALPTRLLVHESIYDGVLEKLVAIAKTFKVGNPMDPGVTVGPLISSAACARVQGMLDRVKQTQSGRIVLGGGRLGGGLAAGNFIEPTIIADVDPKSEIAQVEVFGPVLVVMKFSSEEEAIEIANGTDYGLAAFIQSRDVARVHRVAERLKAGGVYVNGADIVAPHMPFGGVGISGYGREGGRAGIDEFVLYRTVVIA